MENNEFKKQYLVIVPIFLGALLLASIMGIISVAIQSNIANRNLTITTPGLGKDEFDSNPIFIDGYKSSVQVDIEFLSIQDTLNEKSFSVFSTPINIYISSVDPTLFNSGNNISSLLSNVAFKSKLLAKNENAYAKASFNLVDLEGSKIFLILANPNDFSYYISADVKIDTHSGLDSSSIISIVGMSLLSVFFLFLFIFSMVEIIEPPLYTSKILTEKLNKSVEVFIADTESFEIVILLISLISFPFGVGYSLAGYSNSVATISGIGIIVVYLKVDNRRKTIRTIKHHLKFNSPMTIAEIAKLFTPPKNQKDILKTIYFLISHEAYPIRFDVKTNSVFYLGENSSSTNPLNQSIHVPVNESENMEEVEELPICVYCGAEAIIPTAKFCAECGSSMVAAK